MSRLASHTKDMLDALALSLMVTVALGSGVSMLALACVTLQCEGGAYSVSSASREVASILSCGKPIAAAILRCS